MTHPTPTNQKHEFRIDQFQEMIKEINNDNRHLHTDTEKRIDQVIASIDKLTDRQNGSQRWQPEKFHHKPIHNRHHHFLYEHDDGAFLKPNKKKNIMLILFGVLITLIVALFGYIEPLSFSDFDLEIIISFF